MSKQAASDRGNGMSRLRTGATLRTEKKDRERQLLRRFASRHPGYVPSGQLDDFERPDFVLSTDDGTVVGMELIDYVRGQTDNEGGSTDLKDEKDHEAVAGQAENMFNARNGASVEVHLIWHPGRHLRKSDRTPLASALAELVEANVPEKALETNFIEDQQLRGTRLRRYLSDVLVTRLPGRGRGVWSSFESAWTAVSEEELQSILDSKEEDVRGYHENLIEEYDACEAIWLLIVAEGRYAASLVDLPRSAESRRYRTSFDKAFFWDMVRDTVLALHDSA